jgi:hypothetical protein
VPGEPIPGQPRDLLQGPRFLEQVRRAGHDLQARPARQFPQGAPVQLDDHRVPGSDDQQRRLADRAQGLAGEVRTAAAGDHRGHRGRPVRGRDQRGRRARAGAEQPGPQPRRGRECLRPVGQRGHPVGEQGDVEPEMPGPHVQLLFAGGEQVGQDGGQPGGVQLAGHVAVARAVPATAATVREQYHPAGVIGHGHVGAQLRAACRDLEAALDQAHGHTANG